MPSAVPVGACGCAVCQQARPLRRQALTPLSRSPPSRCPAGGAPTAASWPSSSTSTSCCMASCSCPSPAFSARRTQRRWQPRPPAPWPQLLRRCCRLAWMCPRLEVAAAQAPYFPCFFIFPGSSPMPPGQRHQAAANACIHRKCAWRAFKPDPAASPSGHAPAVIAFPSHFSPSACPACLSRCSSLPTLTHAKRPVPAALRLCRPPVCLLIPQSFSPPSSASFSPSPACHGKPCRRPAAASVPPHRPPLHLSSYHASYLQSLTPGCKEPQAQYLIEYPSIHLSFT